MANKSEIVIENIKWVFEQVPPKKLSAFLLRFLNSSNKAIADYLSNHIRNAQAISTYRRKIRVSIEAFPRIKEEIEEMKFAGKKDAEIVEHAEPFLKRLERELGVDASIGVLKWFNDTRNEDTKGSTQPAEYIKKKAREKQRNYYRRMQETRKALEEEGYDVRNTFTLRDLQAIREKGEAPIKEETSSKEEAPKEETPTVDTTKLKNIINASIKEEDKESLLEVVNDCKTEEDVKVARALIDETIKGYKQPTPKKEETLQQVQNAINNVARNLKPQPINQHTKNEGPQKSSHALDAFLNNLSSKEEDLPSASLNELEKKEEPVLKAVETTNEPTKQKVEPKPQPKAQTAQPKAQAQIKVEDKKVTEEEREQVMKEIQKSNAISSYEKEDLKRRAYIATCQSQLDIIKEKLR